MNILFFIDRYPGYGGIETVTTYLSNFFVSREHRVSIFAFQSQAKELLLQNLSDRVEYIEAVGGINYIEDSARQLHDYIVSSAIDVVIFQDDYASIENVLFSAVESTKCKIICVEHNTPDYSIIAYKHSKATGLYSKVKRLLFGRIIMSRIRRKKRRRLRYIYARVDAYVLLSDAFVEIWKRMSGIEVTNKLFVITNPVTISVPHSRPQIKEKVCMYCGRLTFQKGIDKLLSIWGRVAPQYPDWNFIIVGDGDLRYEVEKYIKSHGLVNVKCEGAQKEVEKYYRCSSIICMTSIFEGFGLVLLESMAYGCVPILFNSYASAEDIIASGENGVLIPPFSIGEYVNQLTRLMSSEQDREEMSVNGYNSIKKFSIEKIGNKWLRLIERL